MTKIERSGIVEVNLVARAIMVAEAISIRDHLMGRKNLEMAREIIREGFPLFILSNHRSNADGPAMDKALRQSGFLDIAERLVFLKGTGLDHSLGTKFLAGSLPHIRVLPKKEKDRSNALSIARLGMRAVKESVGSGRIVVIFPEGGRTRTGGLIEAVPAIATYLCERSDAYILPVGLIGTDNVLPVEQEFPRKRADVHVIFGKPFSIAEFCQEMEIQKIDKQGLMDGIMKAKIAPLLPVEIRGIYA